MVPFWFIVIAVLWTGFFILEGFDFGVGMLHSVVGQDEAGRRAAINTIGPLWDGNEVWLIVAGAAMFAAFPGWYATMFSALYLALALLLASLIIRGVAFEYRGKRDAARWRRTWDVLLIVGSVLAPLLIGVGLGDLLHGLPINSAQNYTGSFWTLLQPYALFTGVTLVLICVLHGATIGLAFLTALLQTAWYRTKRDEYLRLTKFFGTLLVINVAIGVVTGIVQEFEFGMNWGAYSRLVGNIFGAPLAMEGLAAFFLESTFLGLWLFGWDKLSRRVHLATIWLVTLGSMLSAAFILAANSWMQHPVGYKMVNGKPQLDNLWAVFTNPVFVWGYSKVIFVSLVTGAVIMLAVSAWQLRHGGDREVFTRSARLALIVLVPAMLFTLLVGDELGVIEGQYQPMKIAAAEAQWTTCQPCSFSLFQIGGGNQDQTPTQIIEIPHLLSLLATNHWNGKVVGLNPLQSQYSKSYGPGYYVPDVFIQYWSMRVMAYLGGLVLLFALWGLWLVRREKLATSRWFLWAAVWVAVLPFLMNTAGWLLTESGRQPWIVQGIMLTKNGISPTVSTTWLWISVVGFVLLYGTLGTVDFLLMLRYSREQLPPPRADAEADAPVPAVHY